MEDKAETRKIAIDYLAFGSIIFVWGILLLAKQIGIIERNISTLPFPLAAFGALLVLSGIVKLAIPRQRQNE